MLIKGQCYLKHDCDLIDTFQFMISKLQTREKESHVCSLFQALTPHMQALHEGSSASRTVGKLLGPALGDQQQGSLSINLWKNAFQDAFQRLCPVRAEAHECGCLPVIARMVHICICLLSVNFKQSYDVS